MDECFCGSAPVVCQKWSIGWIRLQKLLFEWHCVNTLNIHIKCTQTEKSTINIDFGYYWMPSTIHPDYETKIMRKKIIKMLRISYKPSQKKLFLNWNIGRKKKRERTKLLLLFGVFIAIDKPDFTHWKMKIFLFFSSFFWFNECVPIWKSTT